MFLIRSPPFPVLFCFQVNCSDLSHQGLVGFPSSCLPLIVVGLKKNQYWFVSMFCSHLALFSVLSPGRVWGTIWGARVRTQLRLMPRKCPPSALSPWPKNLRMSLTLTNISSPSEWGTLIGHFWSAAPIQGPGVGVRGGGGAYRDEG